VELTANAQPAAYTAQSASAAGPGRFQTVPPDRLPQPEQQRQHQVRGQHEGRPFGRAGHDACPAALEPRAGHDGVPDRKQGQQEQVDGGRGQHGGARPLVDARGHAEACKEARRVTEHCQEEQVHGHRVHQDDQRGHPGQLRAPRHRKAGRLGGV
jgi:hypothetical protein